MSRRHGLALSALMSGCTFIACSADIGPSSNVSGNAGTSGDAGAAGNAGTTGGSTSSSAGGTTGGTASKGGAGGSSGTTASAGRGGTGGSAGKGGTGGSAGKGGSGGSGSSGGAGGTGGAPTLASCPVFPSDSAWNLDISKHPVHSNSNNFIDSIGRTQRMHADFGTVWEGAPIGIPYVLVGAGQARVPIQFDAYGSESDPGPYPIPLNAPIEGNGVGDSHVIAIDTSACKLYELFAASRTSSGFRADSGAVWDLRSNAPRKLGWTSADAAGLPIFPGLVRYDEVVEKRVISHALRFTVQRSRAAYVAPATHYASSSTSVNDPPMGLRLRMKAGFNCASYSPEVQVICTALKRYGMIVADNGSDWYLSGSPDSRWSDENLADLGAISGDAFEVVDTGPIKTY